MCKKSLGPTYNYNTMAMLIFYTICNTLKLKLYTFLLPGIIIKVIKILTVGLAILYGIPFRVLNTPLNNSNAR